MGPLLHLCKDTGRRTNQTLSKRREKQEVDRMETQHDEQKIVDKDDDKFDEVLATLQKTIEIAASNVAHHTKAERETYIEYAGKCQIT